VRPLGKAGRIQLTTHPHCKRRRQRHRRKSRCWRELRHHDIIRATRALFIGTPKGLNHFHDLYQNAQAQAHWQAFRYTTEEGGNVSPEEIESASSEQDKRTYQQEFQASFENLSHGASTTRSVAVTTCGTPGGELYWSLDFKRGPDEFGGVPDRGPERGGG
jgi:hypothetical protein